MSFPQTPAGRASAPSGTASRWAGSTTVTSWGGAGAAPAGAEGETRFLAYIPEGPVLPWDRAVTDLAAWLQPLLDHTKTKGAFALKMGPAVATRRWRAETVKAAIADDEVTRLGDVPPTTKWPPDLPCKKPSRRPVGIRMPAAEPASAMSSRAMCTSSRWRGAPRTRCSPASTSCGVAMCARPRRAGGSGRGNP